MPPPTCAVIDAIFCSRAQATLPDGTPSGIIKAAVALPIALGHDGLAGDYHADRSVHGGPDKALHQFPSTHYAVLAAAFPDLADSLVAGTIGENLSAARLDETQVCIGDVFALGGARIALTQPRRPCWKIDQRYGARGLAALIRERGLTGWYYRVLEPATIAPGAELELLERAPGAPSVAEFHRLTSTTRPPLAGLERCAGALGLPPALRERLSARLAWLRRHG